MGRILKTSIKAKLLFFLLSSLIVILSVVAVSIYSYARDILVTELEATISAESQNISWSINEELSTAAAVVDQMDSNRFIGSYVESVHTQEDMKSSPNYDITVQSLKKMKASDINFTSSFIGFDRPGYLLVDSEWENPSDFVLKERDWYKKTFESGRLTFSDPYLDKVSGKMVITVSTPVTDSHGTPVGVGGIDITIDRISEIMKDYKIRETGYAFLIDKEGILLYHPVSERILKENMTGYEGKSGEIGKKMVNGESGVDTVTLENQNNYIAYAPIKSNGWSIGIVVPDREVEAELAKFKIIFFIAIFSALLLLALIIYNITSRVLKPIPVLLKSFEAVTSGDLTADAVVGTQDEIGRLSGAFNIMLDSQRDIIKQVLVAAREISSTVDNAGLHMSTLNSQIEDVSATTEELSAGLEETAASAEEMNAITGEIEKAVDSVTQKAQEGAAAAGEISKKANTLRESFFSSQQKGIKTFINVKEKLEEALEESKAVEQINSLADSILQITSQTNLLALNAAIEAARAGEAGKGFSVVAEEIRKLAEDSKKAVSQIQTITRTVIQSVGNLSVNSNNLLNFMSGSVYEDYKAMLNATDEYKKDAEFIDSLVTDFSATSEELSASMENIVKSINEISSATNEGASGAYDTSKRIGTVVQKSNEVMFEAGKAKDFSEKLNILVSRFKI